MMKLLRKDFVVIALVIGMACLAAYFPRAEYAFPPQEVSVTQARVGQEIKISPDIAYGNHPRHKFDLYTPAEFSHTAVFVHGGYWKKGDKASYAGFGRYLAGKNIQVAVPNFRLAPEVKIGEQMDDLCRAVKKIRSQTGGKPVALIGHSSGAHMASLLAVDPWNQADGVKDGIFCIVPISGVYQLTWNLWLSGSGDAFEGVSRRQYSPYDKIKRGAPPFLIVYAENDYKTLPSQSKDFHDRLLRVGVHTEIYMIPKADHLTELASLTSDSPAGKKIADWVKGR